MASRPPRSFPTRGNQEAPFVSLDTGPYQAAGGLAFWGLEKGVFGQPLPIHSSWQVAVQPREASRGAFLRR